MCHLRNSSCGDGVGERERPVVRSWFCTPSDSGHDTSHLCAVTQLAAVTGPPEFWTLCFSFYLDVRELLLYYNQPFSNANLT